MRRVMVVVDALMATFAWLKLRKSLFKQSTLILWNASLIVSVMFAVGMLLSYLESKTLVETSVSTIMLGAVAFGVVLEIVSNIKRLLGAGLYCNLCVEGR